MIQVKDLHIFNQSFSSFPGPVGPPYFIFNRPILFWRSLTYTVCVIGHVLYVLLFCIVICAFPTSTHAHPINIILKQVRIQGVGLTPTPLRLRHGSKLKDARVPACPWHPKSAAGTQKYWHACPAGTLKKTVRKILIFVHLNWFNNDVS